MKKYSVLMSVYYKENPEYLKLSIESMLNQTIKPSEFVLICDGKLTEQLDSIINEYEKNHIFKVIHLEKNMGLGNALKIGIENCSNELIARMDSDDISKQDRCEKQLKLFEENDGLGIVGGNIEEFENSPQIINFIRTVPENQRDILKFLKKRNPFNHPSVMYKKSEVLKCGNYKSVRYMQDYFLWIDMLSNGTIGYNIQDILVSMRANNNLYKRRSGLEYLKIQRELLQYMKGKRLINFFEYYIFLTLRSVSSLLPNSIRKFFFTKMLRKKVV